MAFDLTWPKIAALTIVQSAAGTALSALGNGAFDVINADWETVLSLTAGSAVSTFLALVLAYRLPNGSAAQAFVAAPAAAAVADSVTVTEHSDLKPLAVSVHDERDARGQ